MMIAGAVNPEVCELYVEPMLVPVWRVGASVWLDHVKFPYSERALRVREAAGAKGLPMPAYSPDFNPLAHGMAKIKETWRSLKARTKRKLYHALAKAIEKGTTDDILGWFKHCGYVFSLN